MKLEEIAKTSDGLSFTQNAERWILYDADEPATRTRFTVAHELGHLLLGGDYIGNTPQHLRISALEQTLAIETLANRFAADLLVPSCVLWGLQLTFVEQVASICNISIATAKIRWKRLQQLRLHDALLRQKTGKGCFLSSPLERQVFNQFKPYIIECQVTRQSLTNPF